MSTSITFPVSLAQYRLLKVEGPDSERFLQGQLTCDVVKLADQHWEAGACCTAKGRMVANFIIARLGQDFWLRLPAAQAEALKAHLGKYAVFYKTRMSIDERPLAGRLPDSLQQSTLNGQHPLRADGDQCVLSWPDGREEIWGLTADADAAAWQRADQAMGLVWVEDVSREAWVPQFIDWQVQGGVNFKKGCYTGQEIVARLQYLGKAKKQLVSVSASQPLDLKPLDALHDAHGKSIGEIASWHGQHGLAIVQGEECPVSANACENTVNIATLFYTEASKEADAPSSPD
ncbi:YgfZ/GcvT domain-containing protein [Thalassolituus sp. LLYu03]|uniref:CAF17-like 4Fe-4S cluster assembly/insertion protein YgfZ n=1 Tax=Thalassolituus sp. LLYu03 TaxID=3421656 RepID=UPI003D28AD27